MGTLKKNKRREIFNAFRRIKGMIDKMKGEVELVQEEINLYNAGVFQTNVLLEILLSVSQLLSLKITEELNRPGYKSFREEERNGS
jgi:hypothetical protein